LALPTNTFEARRVVGAKANSLSLVRFDRNDYSVPTAWAHHDVTVVGGIDEVVIAVGPTVVARHPRCWAKERTTYDPRHYLALLERKPGAFDGRATHGIRTRHPSMTPPNSTACSPSYAPPATCPNQIECPTSKLSHFVDKASGPCGWNGRCAAYRICRSVGCALPTRSSLSHTITSHR
jgi:hypothetical protein